MQVQRCKLYGSVRIVKQMAIFGVRQGRRDVKFPRLMEVSDNSSAVVADTLHIYETVLQKGRGVRSMVHSHDAHSHKLSQSSLR